MTDKAKSNDKTKAAEHKPTAAEHKAENKSNHDTKAAADAVAKKVDTTDKLVAGDQDVSRTEHAMGSRQPDDGTYDEQREQPPLESRDVPQRIVTAENLTETPGETGKQPTGRDVIDRDKGDL